MVCLHMLFSSNREEVKNACIQLSNLLESAYVCILFFYLLLNNKINKLLKLATA